MAGLFWTQLMIKLFGQIQGTELTLTWALAVFGSWFLLIIPFMRKKEQIWKRLNQDQEKAAEAWLQAMGMFIGLLIISGLGWCLYYRPLLTDRTAGGLNHEWAKAVFGTWLFLLLPFLIWMYKKTDEIFKSAVARQMQSKPKFKTDFIPKASRLLSATIAAKIRSMKTTLAGGHVVTLTLQDGTKISDVFVLNSSEILGVYNRSELGFEASDIVDVELIPAEKLPPYDESKWLRLDGRV
jgi:hypothetical protein